MPPEPDAAATVVEVDGEQVESYRVRDPYAPDRELLVEFVPASLSQLSAEAVHDLPVQGHTARNAFDGIINSIPKAAAMIESGMTMRVVGPPEALVGLAHGSLELVTSGGRTLGMARDVGSGEIAAHLRFGRSGVTPAMGAVGVFQVMSVMTGQYYLHRIDRKLGQIQSGVDRIIIGQQAEAFGKVAAAARRNKQVHDGLLRGITPTDTDRHALDRADDLANSAYAEAKKNVSHFLGKLKSLDPEGADKGQLRDLWKEASNEILADANLLVFAAFVRHQNNLLELAIDPKGDPALASHIKERVDAERQEMIVDLKELKPIYMKLAYSRTRLDERFLFGAKSLAKESERFSKKWKATRAVLEEPEQKALPPAPEIDLPFLAEISKGRDGELVTAGAVLRQRR